MRTPRVQVDGVEYAPASVTAAQDSKGVDAPWLTNSGLWPSSRTHSAWSEATSSDGHRQCRFCGTFVRDNADLDGHVCRSHDD